MHAMMVKKRPWIDGGWGQGVYDRLWRDKREGKKLYLKNVIKIFSDYLCGGKFFFC